MAVAQLGALAGRAGVGPQVAVGVGAAAGAVPAQRPVDQQGGGAGPDEQRRRAVAAAAVGAVGGARGRRRGVAAGAAGARRLPAGPWSAPRVAESAGWRDRARYAAQRANLLPAATKRGQTLELTAGARSPKGSESRRRALPWPGDK